MTSNSWRLIGGQSYTGLHAEVAAIKKYYPILKTIFLIRTNKNGKILPIDSCPNCESICKKLNINVYSISGLDSFRKD